MLADVPLPAGTWALGVYISLFLGMVAGAYGYRIETIYGRRRGRGWAYVSVGLWVVGGVFYGLSPKV